MSEFPWIVSAAEACHHIERGALVWDSRRQPVWLWQHVAGSQPVRWQTFSQSEASQRGLLQAESDALTESFQALGVDCDRPVIVVGNPQSPWGEEGRLVWTLRSLGHPQTAFVDGGWPALKTLVPLQRGHRSKPQSGQFVPQLDSTWSASRDDVATIVNANDSAWMLLDTRSPREFAGETPYGESRSGRIPGAKPLPLQTLRQPNGYLRSPDSILDRLAQLGIAPETPTIAYCTGGVRSAFVAAVLMHVGCSTVKNYAGSAWEWSALPAADYPLEL